MFDWGKGFLANLILVIAARLGYLDPSADLTRLLTPKETLDGGEVRWVDDELTKGLAISFSVLNKAHRVVVLHRLLMEKSREGYKEGSYQMYTLRADG